MTAEGMIPLESARLLLRRLRDDDLAFLVAYRNDPEVARYQTWHGMTETEGRDFINEYKRGPLDVPGRWAAYAVELKRTGELIGDLAFRLIGDEVRLIGDEPIPDRGGSRQGEIGFTFARPHQGQGFATEAVAAFLDRAFGVFDLHRVMAITDCRNVRCVALLERLGLRREGHFVENIWFKGEWGDEFLYAVLRREWESNRNSGITGSS